MRELRLSDRANVPALPHLSRSRQGPMRVVWEADRPALDDLPLLRDALPSRSAAAAASRRSRAATRAIGGGSPEAGASSGKPPAGFANACPPGADGAIRVLASLDAQAEAAQVQWALVVQPAAQTRSARRRATAPGAGLLT